jgi:hypothetical protein
MAEVPKNRKVQPKIKIFLPELFRLSDPEKLGPIFSSKSRQVSFSQDNGRSPQKPESSAKNKNISSRTFPPFRSRKTGANLFFQNTAGFFQAG